MLNKLFLIVALMICSVSYSQEYEIRVKIESNKYKLKSSSTTEVMIVIISADSFYLFHDLYFSIDQGKAFDTTFIISKDQIDESRIYSKTTKKVLIFSSGCYYDIITSNLDNDCIFNSKIWINDENIFSGSGTWIESQTEFD